MNYKSATISKKLMFQKELMQIKPMHQKNVSFVTIGFFKDIGFKFEEHGCNKGHNLLTKAYSLKDIAILNPKGATFRFILRVLAKMKV